MDRGLACLDVDGTLRSPNGWFHGAQALVRELQSLGYAIALCSARSRNGLRDIARECGATVVSAFGGAYVEKCHGSEPTIGRFALSPIAVRAIVRSATGLGLEAWCYSSNSWWIYVRSDLVEREEQITGEKAVKLDTDLSDDIFKVLLVGGYAIPDAVVSELQGSVPNVRAVRSHDNYLECVSVYCPEDKGLSLISSALGVAPERVFACGDSFNDVAMLTAAASACSLGGKLALPGVHRVGPVGLEAYKMVAEVAKELIFS